MELIPSGSDRRSDGFAWGFGSFIDGLSVETVLSDIPLSINETHPLFSVSEITSLRALISSAVKTPEHSGPSANCCSESTRNRIFERAPAFISTARRLAPVGCSPYCWHSTSAQCITASKSSNSLILSAFWSNKEARVEGEKWSHGACKTSSVYLHITSMQGSSNSVSWIPSAKSNIDRTLLGRRLVRR
jgi:hypothetical protein